MKLPESCVANDSLDPLTSAALKKKKKKKKKEYLVIYSILH